jgi:hypothetical protein
VFMFRMHAALRCALHDVGLSHSALRSVAAALRCAFLPCWHRVSSSSILLPKPYSSSLPLMNDGVMAMSASSRVQYPYDWRTKKPTIFRATDQWFASVESFRSQARPAPAPESLPSPSAARRGPRPSPCRVIPQPGEARTRTRVLAESFRSQRTVCCIVERFRAPAVAPVHVARCAGARTSPAVAVARCAGATVRGGTCASAHAPTTGHCVLWRGCAVLRASMESGGTPMAAMACLCTTDSRC